VLAPVIFFIAILIKLDPYDLVLLKIIDGGSKRLYLFPFKVFFE